MRATDLKWMIALADTWSSWLIVLARDSSGCRFGPVGRVYGWMHVYVWYCLYLISLPEGKKNKMICEQISTHARTHTHRCTQVCFGIFLKSWNWLLLVLHFFLPLTTAINPHCNFFNLTDFYNAKKIMKWIMKLFFSYFHVFIKMQSKASKLQK